jgi:hypothetical protein
MRINCLLTGAVQSSGGHQSAAGRDGRSTEAIPTRCLFKNHVVQAQQSTGSLRQTMPIVARTVGRALRCGSFQCTPRSRAGEALQCAGCRCSLCGISMVPDLRVCRHCRLSCTFLQLKVVHLVKLAGRLRFPWSGNETSYKGVCSFCSVFNPLLSHERTQVSRSRAVQAF